MTKRSENYYTDLKTKKYKRLLWRQQGFLVTNVRTDLHEEKKH